MFKSITEKGIWGPDKQNAFLNGVKHQTPRTTFSLYSYLLAPDGNSQTSDPYFIYDDCSADNNGNKPPTRLQAI